MASKKLPDEEATKACTKAFCMSLQVISSSEIHKLIIMSSDGNTVRFPANIVDLPNVRVEATTFASNPLPSNNIATKVQMVSLKDDGGNEVSIEGIDPPIKIISENQVSKMIKNTIPVRMPGLGYYRSIDITDIGCVLMINIERDFDISLDANLTVLVKYGSIPSKYNFDFNFTMTQNDDLKFYKNLTRKVEVNLIDRNTLIFTNFQQPENGKYTNDTKNHNDAKLYFKFMYEGVMPDIVMEDNYYTLDVLESIGAYNYTLRTFCLKCSFWNPDTNRWNFDGMKVDLSATTLSQLGCESSHLTSFGGFYVAPNPLPPLSFALLKEGYVLLVTVIVIIMFWLLGLILARRADKRDLTKIGVSPLVDNKAGDLYLYEITVITGSKQNAATKSNIRFVITGSDGQTNIRSLQNQQRNTFQQGSVDVFIMATSSSLGDLHYLRIWHDNSKGDWYLSTIEIIDMQTEDKSLFLAQRWLAVDKEDGMIDCLIPAADDLTLKNFDYLFTNKSRQELSDSHLWFSLYARPPQSTFTRCQRLSVAVSLLLCAMLASVMFYGAVPEASAEEENRIGSFSFNWRQVYVAIISIIITLPVNLILVGLFRSIRPGFVDQIIKTSSEVNSSENTISRSESKQLLIEQGNSESECLKPNSESECLKPNPKDRESKEENAEEGSINTNSDVKTIEENSDADFTKTHSDVEVSQANWDKEIKEMNSDGKAIEDHSDTGIKTANSETDLTRQNSENAEIGNQVNISMSETEADRLKDNKVPPTNETDQNKPTKKEKFYLPQWAIYPAWILCVFVILICSFFIMWYGMAFGNTKSLDWLVAVVISVLQDILLLQPLKVFALALFVALIVKKLDNEENKMVDNQAKQLANNDKWLHSLADDTTMFDRIDTQDLQPLNISKLNTQREIRFKENRMKAITREILIYVFFSCVVFLVGFFTRSSHGFLQTRNVENLLMLRRDSKNSFYGVKSYNEFWPWMENHFLNEAYPLPWFKMDERYDDVPKIRDFPGKLFLNDLNSKIVNGIRIRQLRMKADTCTIPSDVKEFMTIDCVSQYDPNEEDTRDYNRSWSQPFLPKDGLNPSNKPWRYQTWMDLDGYPFWGELDTFYGGGYVIEMFPKWKNRIILEELKKAYWIDRHSRAVIIEFTLYNAASNYFNSVVIVFELPPGGGVVHYYTVTTFRLYRFSGNNELFIIACESLFLFFMILFTVRESRLLYKTGWSYFGEFWNLVEVGNIILTVTAIIFYAYRDILGKELLERLPAKQPNTFINFQFAALWDSWFTYIIALICFFVTLKFIKLLRFNRRISLLSYTLKRAWFPLSMFGITFSVVVIATTISSSIIFGGSLYGYRDAFKTIASIIGLLLGKFSYHEFESANRFLGPVFFFLFNVMVNWIIMNMMIAILCDVFTEVQEELLAQENDYELVDYIIDNFKGLLGMEQTRKLLEDESKEREGTMLTLVSSTSDGNQIDDEVDSPRDKILTPVKEENEIDIYCEEADRFLRCLCLHRFNK